jgi:hypothetical protein
MCTGRCGDGLVQSAYEICDNTQPLRCAQLGYDYGHNACTTACGDSSPVACGRHAPRLLFTGDSTEAVDVWRDGDLLVISRDVSLVIVDRGVVTEIAGAFGAIDEHGGTLVVAHGAGVDRIVQSALMPEPDLGAGGTQVVALAFAPSGELWALTRDCKVRVGTAGAWQSRPDFPGTDCRHLGVDATGNVFAGADGFPGNFRWFDGTSWIPVAPFATTNPVAAIGEGNNGFLLATVDNDNAYELHPGTAIPRTTSGVWKDAVGIDGVYLVTGFALGREAANRPVLFFSEFTDIPTQMRRMNDGSVLLWRTNIYELDQMMVEDSYASTNVGARAGTQYGFVTWDQRYIRGYAEPQPTNDTGPANMIRSVAIGGEIVYVATANGLMYGSLGTSWVVEPAVVANDVWANAAGDIAVIAGAEVQVRPALGAWSTLPAPGCVPVAIAGNTVTELYVARGCTGSIDIMSWDGSQWTLVHSTTAGVNDAVSLPDGSIAFGGGKVIVGRAATWVSLPVLGGIPSGTSSTDLWVANVQVTPFAPASIVHWNGVDFAEVRHPTGLDVGRVVADRHTVLALGAELTTFARWAVP